VIFNPGSACIRKVFFAGTNLQLRLAVSPPPTVIITVPVIDPQRRNVASNRLTNPILFNDSNRLLNLITA
jgi:hypothetical protein